MYKYELGAHELLAYLLELLDRGFDNDNIRLDIALLYNQIGLYHHARAFAKTVPTPKAYVLLYNLRGVFPAPYSKSIDTLPASKPPKGQLTICSAASYDYFYALVNLIGSIQQTSWGCLKQIIVYDLGMLRYQKDYLNQLAGVKVKKVPEFAKNCMAFFAWKFWVPIDMCRNEDLGPMLYLDAGIDCQKPLTEILEQIKHESYIAWETGQPTRKWTSSKVYRAFGVREEDDDSTCAFAGLFGLDTSKDSTFRRAWEYAYIHAGNECMLRPHPDCIDNRHDMSLLSMVIKKNGDVVKTPMHPLVGGLDDAPEHIANSTLHVCRHGKIGLHDVFLKRKA